MRVDYAMHSEACYDASDYAALMHADHLHLMRIGRIRQTLPVQGAFTP